MANAESYVNNVDTRRGNGSHREEIKECATHMKDELSKVGRIAKEATQEQLTELQKMGSDQIERVTAYAKERPLTSLLIAGAIGFLGAGYLFRR